MLPSQKLARLYLLHFLSERLRACIWLYVWDLKESRRTTAWKTDVSSVRSHGCNVLPGEQIPRVLPSLLFQDFHLGLTTEGIFRNKNYMILKFFSNLQSFPLLQPKWADWGGVLLVVF